MIPTVAKEAKWKVERIANRREGKRPFVWQVICPETPPELDWDNDFGRGMRCGCRRFPTEGKATRYAARMEAGERLRTKQ